MLVVGIAGLKHRKTKAMSPFPSKWNKTVADNKNHYNTIIKSCKEYMLFCLTLVGCVTV